MKNRLQTLGLIPLLYFLYSGPVGLKTEEVPAGAKVWQAADNSRCLVCHLNYDEEPLAAKHAAANVGCIKCHGVSSAHSSDEDHATAPDTMYPREKIAPACLKCHGGENWKSQHKMIGDESQLKEKVCTQCHGEHRLKIRSRRWDKATGRLVPKTSAGQERNTGE